MKYMGRMLVGLLLPVSGICDQSEWIHLAPCGRSSLEETELRGFFRYEPAPHLRLYVFRKGSVEVMMAPEARGSLECTELVVNGEPYFVIGTPETILKQLTEGEN